MSEQWKPILEYAQRAARVSEEERFKQVVELATELSGDYVDFEHAMNRAYTLLRKGWGKTVEGGADE